MIKVLFDQIEQQCNWDGCFYEAAAVSWFQNPDWETEVAALVHWELQSQLQYDDSV